MSEGGKIEEFCKKLREFERLKWKIEWGWGERESRAVERERGGRSNGRGRRKEEEEEEIGRFGSF